MEQTALPKYYIVEASALPEVFLKVAHAKRLLETGQAGNVNEAAKTVGISRSAFYKYRDAITPFQNLMAGRILTFHFLLRDAPGHLSTILSVFARFSANVLTIHQTIPTNGYAAVTISVKSDNPRQNADELLRVLAQSEGVMKAEILAG